MTLDELLQRIDGMCRESRIQAERLKKQTPAAKCDGGNTEGTAEDTARPHPVVTRTVPKGQAGAARLVYLAGPYTCRCASPTTAASVMRVRYHLHLEAAAWLKRHGWAVLSPIVMGYSVDAMNACTAQGGSFERWRRECFAMLDACDAVVVLALDGLRASEGVRAEIIRAAYAGKPVRMMVPVTHGNDYIFAPTDAALWAGVEE